MILLDLTLRTPEENLALDEALLGRCELLEERGLDGEVLRLWESPNHFVVLGVAGKLHDDVREVDCRREGIPILRRASGGGTVLQGPGSLNFALVFSLRRRPELRDLRRSYRSILERVVAALEIPGLLVAGTSDIALGEMKISGNAQKRTRAGLLHHGTVLHGLDAALVARWLKEPRAQPAYRAHRAHERFLGRVPLSADEIKRRLREAWGASPREIEVPALDDLVADKYGNPRWTERF